jgi:hypothetical protein
LYLKSIINAFQFPTMRYNEFIINMAIKIMDKIHWVLGVVMKEVDEVIISNYT